MENKKGILALLMILLFIGSQTVLNASCCPCSCLNECLHGLFSHNKKSNEELREQLQKVNNSTDTAELTEVQPNIVISPPSQSIREKLPLTDSLSDMTTALTQVQSTKVQQLSIKRAIIRSVNSLNDMSPISHSSTRPPSARSTRNDMPALALPPHQHLLMTSVSHQEAKRPLPHANTFSTVSSCSDYLDAESINEEYINVIMTPNGKNFLGFEDVSAEKTKKLPEQISLTTPQSHDKALPFLQRTSTPHLGKNDDDDEYA